MTSFADLIPDNIITESLGDEVIYQAKTGPLTIKALVGDTISEVFAGEAHLGEKRLQLVVALKDAPGLIKNSKFMINGKKYTLDAIIDNDDHFATCLVIPA